VKIIDPSTSIKYNHAHEVSPRCIFSDPYGVLHEALITQVWSVNQENEPMTVNLVHASKDEKKTDQYGQQIEHRTSVPRVNEHSAHGMWFCLDVKEIGIWESQQGKSHPAYR
jgi:hypothetical protein